MADPVGTADGTAAAPLWDLKRDLVLLREELQAKNVTIRTLKNELRAAGVRSLSRTKSNSSSTSCCNVATQTDRVINTFINIII